MRLDVLDVDRLVLCIGVVLHQQQVGSVHVDGNSAIVEALMWLPSGTAAMLSRSTKCPAPRDALVALLDDLRGVGVPSCCEAWRRVKIAWLPLTSEAFRSMP